VTVPRAIASFATEVKGEEYLIHAGEALPPNHQVVKAGPSCSSPRRGRSRRAARPSRSPHGRPWPRLSISDRNRQPYLDERSESGGNPFLVLLDRRAMRGVHWLHAVAALWLIAFGSAGMWLVVHRGPVPLGTMGDCLRPPGYSGSFQCYTQGHPYALIGSLVLVVVVTGTVLCWRIGTNLQAGRTARGYPRG
jgi:hypothetical protein